MSLLKDFSPKKTREKKSGPETSKNRLTEVHSGPVQKIKHDDNQNIKDKLIEKYAWRQNEEKASEEKNNDYFRAIAQKEQKGNNKVLKEEPQNKVVATSEQLLQKSKASRTEKIAFSFFELRLKCEEYLLHHQLGVKNIKFEKILELQKKFINDKMEIISEYKKEISFENFKDVLYYYKGEIIIPEEYIDLTGFLREYFDVKRVAILYNTGEIIIEECKYCNFWFKKRLDKFFNKSLRELSHSEIENNNNCLQCFYNWSCPFARIQQMTKSNF